MFVIAVFSNLTFSSCKENGKRIFAKQMPRLYRCWYWRLYCLLWWM